MALRADREALIHWLIKNYLKYFLTSWIFCYKNLICFSEQQLYFFPGKFFLHTHIATERRSFLLVSERNRVSFIFGRTHKGEKKIFSKKMQIDEKQDLGFSVEVLCAWKRISRNTNADRSASKSELKIERSINFCYLYELGGYRSPIFPRLEIDRTR